VTAGAPGKGPKITIPKTAAPKTLRVRTLIKGWDKGLARTRASSIWDVMLAASLIDHTYRLLRSVMVSRQNRTTSSSDCGSRNP
jgi:hypothetical protein